MKYVTERQRDILNFIREFQEERGIAPTHREICDHFGFSSYGTVYKHLSLLEKKGLIRRDWNQKRGVELVGDHELPKSDNKREDRPAARELPLFGYIAAGRPLDVDVSDEMIAVPEHLTSRGENYVLKVRGEVDGLDTAGFEAAAATAKAGCPVSKALTGVEITLDAALES